MSVKDNISIEDTSREDLDIGNRTKTQRAWCNLLPEDTRFEMVTNM
jgi:hypothetical protein